MSPIGIIGLIGLGLSVFGAIAGVIRTLMRKPLSRGWIIGLVVLFAGSTVVFLSGTVDVVTRLSSGGADGED